MGKRGEEEEAAALKSGGGALLECDGEERGGGRGCSFED
jgi:hypothetical protein